MLLLVVDDDDRTFRSPEDVWLVLGSWREVMSMMLLTGGILVVIRLPSLG